MGRYLHEPCGYECGLEVGDPDGGIAPRAVFEDIPNDWVHPICGLNRDVLVKM